MVWFVKIKRPTPARFTRYYVYLIFVIIFLVNYLLHCNWVQILMAQSANSHTLSLPENILRVIFGIACNFSVESLDRWSACLPLLATTRNMRSLFLQILYANVILEISFTNDHITCSSNLPLVIESSLGTYAKSLIVYAPKIIVTGADDTAFYNCIARYVSHWVGLSCYPPRLAPATLVSLGIACIAEPMSLQLLNVAHMYINYFDLRNNSTSACSVLFSYSTKCAQAPSGIPTDYCTSYITKFTQQYTSFGAQFVNSFSAFSQKTREACNIPSFYTGALDLLNAIPLTIGDLGLAVMQDTIARTPDKNVLYSTMAALHDTHDHLLCMPAIRYLRSDGSEVRFDVYRIVRSYDTNFNNAVGNYND